MTLASRMRSWMWAMLRRTRMENEMSEELRFHVEAYAEDLVRDGMPRTEAMRRAKMEFGGAERVKEECRESRGVSFVESLAQDLRFGLRMLRKSPGFTTVAVLTLALGIGANTTMFSAVNAVLFRPLPYKDPGRLVDIWCYNTKTGVTEDKLSYPNFLDFRKQGSAFDGMAVYRETHVLLRAGGNDAQRIPAAVVSPELFDVLGVTPEFGRTFLSDEAKPGDGNVVILGHELWSGEFHADPGVVGRQIVLDRAQYTVVGVMPRGFAFPVLAAPIQLWVPVAYDGTMTTGRGTGIYEVVARLKTGVSTEQGTAQVDAIETRLGVEYPDYTTAGERARVVPELPDLVKGSRGALLVLFGVVCMVLLIACANVANLILARGASRGREISIRTSLGAGRARIARQLFTESALLSLLGGGAGLAVGYWAVRLLVALGPRDIPRLASIGMDARVFWFTLGVSLLTSVFFGLAPAWRASRAELTESLKDRGPNTISGVRGGKLRDTLVVAEIALSLVTLLGAGLLVETLWRLQRASPGFDPRNVLTFSVDLPDSDYTDARTAQYFDELLPRLRALPGVESASAVFPLPFSATGINTSFDIKGRTYPKGAEPIAYLCAVDREYFKTMRTPLLRGKDFSEGSPIPGQGFAVVNEEFAQRYFPHVDPIGQWVKPGAQTTHTPALMSEVIGVAANVKMDSLREDAKPIVYVPIAQLPIGALSVIMRVRGGSEGLLSAVRQQAQAIDSRALIFGGETLQQYLGATLGQPQFNALLLAVFGILAVALAMVGLFGSISYVVSQRTHEIGIRMALGAEPSQVLRMVLTRGLKLAVAGVAIGAVASSALTRLMASLLFGVSATDPAVFACAGALLMIIALAACYIPARRAMKVDPMTALRYE